MRNTLTVLLFLLCWGVSSVQGQTALEKAVKRINVSVNMPSFFNASQNEEFIGVVEVTEKDPLPTLAQNYGFEPAYGNTAIGVIFGGVDAILEHKDGDYLVIVYVSPGRGGGKYGDIITDSTVLYTLNNLSFSRIKKNLDMENRWKMHQSGKQMSYILCLRIIQENKRKKSLMQM